MEQNKEDRLGDGDQSEIRRAAHQQFYRNLFSQGGDIAEWFSSGMISEFAVACVSGDVCRVQQMLEQAEQDFTACELGKPCDALVELLERRETSLRLSPLLMIVSAGKNIDHGGSDPALESRQIKVA